MDIMLVNSVEELCDSVREDRADLGFSSHPKGIDFSEFHWLHLKDDPLGKLKSFPLEAFEGKDFLISAQGFDPTILSTVEESGAWPIIRPSAMDDLTVITLVSHGMGVSMLTELVLEGCRENVCALPVCPLVFRELGVISCPTREAGANLRRFLNCAEKTVQEFYQPKIKKYGE